MDPEMIRAAQEHMKRMRPEDIQRMQQMMTPEMMRVAMENMKNMRPEDLKLAAEQMKNLSPEQIAQMSSQMGPGTAGVMNQRRQYEYNAAASLKNQGNQLHGDGKYGEAAEKYLRAKTNLAGHVSSESIALRRACLVNLMSCYLKTKHYDEVVTHGSEVLKEDSNNVKALYRRGQAYKEQGNLKAAVADLKRAADLSPDDETLASVLRDARIQLQEKGDTEDDVKVIQSSDGLIIEDITEEEAQLSNNSESMDSFSGASNASSPFPGRSPFGSMDDGMWQMQMEALQKNPDLIRQMQAMMGNVDPETLAALSGGAVSPEMARTASQMMKNMAPEELERYTRMARTMHPGVGRDSFASSSPSHAPAAVLQEATGSGTPVTETITGSRGTKDTLMRGREEDVRNSQRLGGDFSDLGAGPGGLPSMTPEMQRQMQEQMKNPEMMKMMTEMMKGMSPETMAEMSEKAGFKMSAEQARKAQEAMAQLTPEQMTAMMKWAERANRAKEVAGKAKDWLLRQPLLLLAVLVLLLAVVLHYLGYVG